MSFDNLYGSYSSGFDYSSFENEINNFNLFGTGSSGYSGGGFDQMTFDDVNDMFGLVGNDWMDGFSIDDREYLNSIGLDGNAMVQDAFGYEGFDANNWLDDNIGFTLNDIAQVNPSVNRNLILTSQDADIAAEAKLEAAAEELHYIEQNYSNRMHKAQIQRAYGFLDGGEKQIDLEHFEATTVYDENGNVIEQGDIRFKDFSEYGRVISSIDEEYALARENYAMAVGEYMQDPGYDGRFDTVDEDGNRVFSQALVDDYRYLPYQKTDEEIKEVVERDLFTIPGLTGEGELLDSGEKNTALGKLIAIGLDAVGFSDIGTKLYLTQSTWNATVNALEAGFNRIFGTAIDVPLTVNIHEIGAALLNEKFVNKNGEPILEKIANKAEFFIPFYEPEFAIDLAMLGGNNLGSFTPTGENILEHITDNLLEGQVLDRVQELSDEGKFEGVQSSRGRGIMGFVDDVTAFVQSGGVALQKLFGPGLSQAIVDFAFFDGMPAGAILNGIGQTLGPQSAQDWVRYLEKKGIDPNDVQERDISYYRALIDDFLTDPTVTASGVTPYSDMIANLGDGGIVTKYLSSLDEHLYNNYGKGLDQLDPADLSTILYKEMKDHTDYVRDSFSTLTDVDLYAKYSFYESMVGYKNAIEGTNETAKPYDEWLEEWRQGIQEDASFFSIGNGFTIDQRLVVDLMDAAGTRDLLSTNPQALDDNFEYIISDGEKGTALPTQYYNENIELNTDLGFGATRSVDEDVILLPDLEVRGFTFDYVRNPDGPDGAYDPLTGVTYEFQSDRFINNPGTQDDRYLFPMLTAEDLATSTKDLNPKKITDLAKRGRIEYGELIKYVKENPYAYLGQSMESYKGDLVAHFLQNGNKPSERKSIAVFKLQPGIDYNQFIQSEGINRNELDTVSKTFWAGIYNGNYGNQLSDQYFTIGDLSRNGIDPFSDSRFDIAGLLQFLRYGDRADLNEFVYHDADERVARNYNDPTEESIMNVDAAVQDYYLNKYTGENQEMIGDIKMDILQGQLMAGIFNDYSSLITLGDALYNYGLTDETGDIAVDNIYYLEDYQMPSEYRPVENYELFVSPEGFVFIEDTDTKIVESYDPDRLNTTTGEYEFDRIEDYDFARLTSRIGDTNQTTRSRAATAEVLKYLYATGQLTKEEVLKADFRAYSGGSKYGYSNWEFQISDSGEGYYAPGSVANWGQLYDEGNEVAKYGFDFNEDGEFSFMEDYVIETPEVVNPVDEEAFIFSNLPDFVVSGFNTLDDLNNAYQDRLDFIDDLDFDYSEKDFLRQSAYNLFESRKAFLELDETSQQLILDAQAEATSNFVDLGVFTVTATSVNKLNEELQERLNLINAADLSEEQRQYEINLANAIFDAKASEIATIGQQNSTILTLRQQKDNFETLYGSESDKVKNLQDRIDKIETYEIPEFNVTAYMTAEDPSAYMQNFVNEVRKGTTEEFGNVLSIENADQILNNVAALAQSETDLQIVTTERDANYQKYVDETQKYNTAISERDNAIQQRDANQIEINKLKGQLYVELDNFEVTATDINGAQGQLNDFNAEIDRMVTDGEITSEQGELEKSLATNSFNVFKATKDIAAAQAETEELQTFSLPEFNITATNQVELDAYLDSYQTYVDDAEKAGNISEEQALNFDTIIASIRNNGSQIFTLEAENKTKQDEIDRLEGVNTGLDADILDRDNQILDLTGTISVIATGFDVTLYDDISDLDAGLASYIQGINDSDLDEEMKASQIAFAESMANIRRENLFVPTYEAPDFSVVAEGDLTGLNTSYSEAMFTLNSYKDNEYITQEEFNTFVNDLNTAYNTRREEIIPTYELPEFTVSELDAEGGFTNLEAEKEEFESELLSFLTNEYISQAEYEAFRQQIDDAFESKRREITPIYDLPDFSVYETLQPGEDFTDIDTEYNNALDTLNTNARLGYISTSEYIDAYTELNDSYESARKGIAPVYQLPDFSTFGQIAEGDDTTAIDDFYQNELSKLEQYKDSGYISLSEYYGFLGQLESEYTTRREGILPTYTMPDFSVTPASSLAELEEIQQAALDRFTMFSESEYFPEDFDILAERQNLLNLIDAERARLRGTYVLPEFTVTDTQGVLTQQEIEDLFSEYEEDLSSDVLEGLLGFDDFRSAMQGARRTFDFEFEKREPIQPRVGGYEIIPDPINDDELPSGIDYEFPTEIIKEGGIDTSGILTGNYMAKLDPAYQLAEILLGQDRAKQMYPTGKSRGLADEEFQDIVSQFMLGQAEDAFELQSGLSGKMQDLATEQRRLQRQADLDLMAEFGDPYKKQLEELYPEQAAALKQQREIADIAAERAKGDLSPREQAQVEQQGYLYGAGRGREFDPVSLYRQLGEETGIREQRETQATNQLTSLMNMERGMYGDLPSVIGAQSPFIEGVGDITTPFNIGGIMDLGSVDFANQQRLQETNMAIAQLQRDYDTAVALRQPSKAEATLVKLNQYKAQADALSAGLSAGVQAFGTLKDIFGGIGSFLGGNKSSGSINTSSFNYGSTTPVDYTDKDAFARYLYGMGF